MGLFDGHITNTDWNGDGVVDSWDDAMFGSMVMMQVENEMREDRINAVVRAIAGDGVSKHIGNAEFELICASLGLRVSDFDQSDIDEIQRRLNRW